MIWLTLRNNMWPLTRNLLVRNPVSFYLQRRAYFRRYPINRTNGADPDILEILANDGVCVIENYFAPDTVNSIRDEVSELMFALRDARACTATQAEASSKPEYGTYVLHHIEKFSASSRVFTQDKLINAVANAYLGGSAVSYDVRAELRSEARKNDFVDDWHWDTWKHRFKAFLYLTDVTEENAPMRYLTGSHTGENWRARRFWLQYAQHAFGGGPMVQRHITQGATKLYHNPAFTEKICTGPAGTLILFDTRGVHRGSPLKKPYRLLLNHSFAVQEDLPSRKLA